MTVAWLYLALLFGLLLVLALVLFLPHPRSWTKPRGSAARPPTPTSVEEEQRHWYGVLYHNPTDPNPLVPKRYGFGWTVNFGHPAGKVVLLIIIGLVLLPIVFALLGVHLPPVGCHPSGCYPAP